MATTRPQDISTIVGLLRVSTEAQEKEGYSLAAQQTAYERDCRTFGWRSLDTFEGQETGSALSQRQIIHDLIACIRNHRPDAVWVIEQSRLTRGDELDVAVLLRELRESGAKVVLERGTIIDPTDLEGAFMFRLKALMDRREWEVIAARNWRGKDEKAKLGLLVNARPAYGYTTTGEGKGKGKRVPVPTEADVVRQIYEWKAAGVSIRQIIRRLFEQGVPAPTQAGRTSGKLPQRFKNGIQLWAETTVKRILDNPLYLGVSFHRCWVTRGKSLVFDRTNPKAVWIENAHEAIISQELWDAAHRQLDAQHYRRSLNQYMLTGIMICPHCGSTLNATSSGGNRGPRYAYYFCASKRQKPDEWGRRQRTGTACPSGWWRADRTDRMVWEAFIKLISSPDMVEQLLSSVDAEKKRERLRALIRDLTTEAEQIETMKARAREKLLAEILTDGEYLKERERLQTQLEGTAKRLATAKVELKVCSKEAGMQVIQNLAMLKLGEKKLTQEQRSRLFHALVKRVVPRDAELTEVEIDLYVTPESGVLQTPAGSLSIATLAVTVSLAGV
ncbi:MAG: recombinase family protein [Phycisphaerae bacterium]|nr:recombinase family protein [Phycisphaerae bacterium]